MPLLLISNMLSTGNANLDEERKVFSIVLLGSDFCCSSPATPVTGSMWKDAFYLGTRGQLYSDE
jgi:hypothetical protein